MFQDIHVMMFDAPFNTLCVATPPPAPKLAGAQHSHSITINAHECFRTSHVPFQSSLESSHSTGTTLSGCSKSFCIGERTR